jgi:hypothetical protein
LPFDASLVFSQSSENGAHVGEIRCSKNLADVSDPRLDVGYLFLHRLEKLAAPLDNDQ